MSEIPQLLGARSALAVVAHPDDESFGLGGVLLGLTAAGLKVRLLCLTAGEASTVGAASDLAQTRRAELVEAAARLGLGSTSLLRFPDGGLEVTPQSDLEAAVESEVAEADLVVVFEPGGVTGHPDHIAATAAAEAVADRHGIPSLEWGLGQMVADTLRKEFGVPFVPFQAAGSRPVEVTVDRSGQKLAISCHRSQDPENQVLTRRLSLESDTELLRTRSAPFLPRLNRLSRLASRVLDADATPQGRLEILELIIAFAGGDSWPEGVLEELRRLDGPRAHCLRETSAWRLNLLSEGHEHPATHPEIAWTAVATVDGVAIPKLDSRSAAQPWPCEELIVVPKGGGWIVGGDSTRTLHDSSIQGATLLCLEVFAP